MKRLKYNYWAVYTFVFALLSLAVFLPFIVQGKSLVWALDGLPLHTTNTVYFKSFIEDLLKNGITGSVDYTLGMGMDPILWLSTWYTEPLNFLSLLFPPRYIEFLYTFLIIVRFYLSGIAFSLFTGYMGRDGYQKLFGSVIYVFSGYALFAGIRHAAFMIPMIYLPILLITIERVIRGRGVIPLILVVFISMSTSYYYSYMNAIIAALYYICRCISSKGKVPFIRRTLGIIYAYIAGTFMSACILLPSLLHVLSSGRTSSGLSGLKMLLYPIYHIPKLFASYIAPARGAGYWIVLSFAAVTFLCIILLFLRRRAEDRCMRLLFIVLTVMLCIPLCGYVLNGFSTVSNRWCYAYAFAVSFISASMVYELFSVDKRKMKILLVCCIAYLPTLLFFRYEYIGAFMLLLFMIVIFEVYKGRIKLKLAKCLMLVLLCFNIFVNAFTDYSGFIDNYAEEFANAGSVYDTLISGKEKAYHTSSDSFGRIDNADGEYITGNKAELLGYNGISYTYSVFTKDFIDFSIATENAGLYCSNYFSGFDSRPVLNLLACVTDSIKDGELMKEEHSLPFAYVYTSSIAKDRFDSLSMPDKEKTLLSSVVLEHIPHGIETSEGEKSVYTIKPCISKDKCIVKKGSKLRMQFNGSALSNTYIRFNYLNEPNVKDGIIYPRVECENGSKTFHITSLTGTYTIGRTSYTVYLGYSEEGIKYCDISIPDDAPVDSLHIDLSTVELVCVKPVDIGAAVDRFNENRTFDIQVGRRKISLKAEMNDEGVLVLSLPYSKGWKCSVDGSIVQTFKANYMYTGIDLKEGMHLITLSYTTPGFYTGLVLSSIGIIMFVICILFEKRVRNRPNASLM